jgi:hypothetical protein
VERVAGGRASVRQPRCRVFHTISQFSGLSPGNVPHILSQLNDNVVWVSEGCGNSPVNGSYTGLAGVEEFFRRVATTAKWDTFEPTNYIPMLDPNVIIVMGR